MASKINIEGAREKFMKLAQVSNATEKIAQDMASFYLSKLLKETLGKSSATVAGVRSGNKFIRVLSGNLRRAQIMVKESDTVYSIHYQEGRAGVDYGKKVNEYAQTKYGMGYYALTSKLWGKTMTKRAIKEMKRLIKNIDEGRAVVYKNPLPL